MGFERLSKSAVFYAKGLPLALKVLGSHLYSRSKETWESALEKLKKYPNMQIQNVLKVSYDGLDEIEKDIFLDIVFFFKGGFKDDVLSVLDACGLYATSGIDHLLDKSLITISDDNKIQIHDLLQEMGEQIVREESIKRPERRSRLKDIEEVHDVLQNNLGTDAIEGIILDVVQVKSINLSANTFKKMPNLRILKMYSESWCKGSNVNVPFGLESFSKKLRYFHWDEYPLESLPLDFYTENLVELHMERSQCKKLWDGVQDLVNLKKINLRGSKQLMELPDFSKACNLEAVQLSDCENLSSVHPSIFSLRLVSLDLKSCQGLKSFCMSDLRSLTSLKQLSLNGCRAVNKMGLHILFDALHSLEELCLKACNNLYEIPDNIGASSLLKFLDLDESNVESLPASIKHLSKLRNFSLNSCCRLRFLPELPAFVKRLHVQHCPSLETIHPSTTSMLEDNDNWDKLDFSFKECLKLDEQSLHNVMGFTHMSMMRAIDRKFSNLDACYPGSTVPKWCEYKEKTGVPFIVQLALASNQLLGIILCCVIPQYASKKTFEINCNFVFEDYRVVSNRVFYFGELNMDHVYLWYCPSKDILMETEGTQYDESIICMFRCKISDEFITETACGVCPIYASKFDNIIEQKLGLEMKLGTKTERHWDIDDDQQLPPTKKLKESCTIEPVPVGLELELANKLRIS